MIERKTDSGSQSSFSGLGHNDLICGPDPIALTFSVPRFPHLEKKIIVAYI